MKRTKLLSRQGEQPDGEPGGVSPRLECPLNGVASPTISRNRGLTAIGSPLFAALCLLFVTGCNEPILREYGDRAGIYGEKSLNGTGVFGKMFEKAGHRVSSWPRLSPAVERRTVIVWFPTDLEKPSDAARQWLEDWLYAQEGRTVIYVGRDFDAAPGYLKRMQTIAPAEQKAPLAEKLLDAEQDFGNVRTTAPKNEDWGWFTIDTTVGTRDVTSLDGPAGWVQDVDAKKLNLQLHSNFIPPPTSEDAPVETLLSSNGDALVVRHEMEGSQLIVVTNGSFLLNVQLVTKEHRKLAARLIQEIGPEKQEVVFLESDSDPEILPKEPGVKLPSGLELLGVPPFNMIFLQWAAVGIIFCFARWPIFGRPRDLHAEAPADFGEHVSAVGELLSMSRDRAYAQAAVDSYHRKLKPEANKSPAAK